MTLPAGQTQVFANLLADLADQSCHANPLTAHITHMLVKNGRPAFKIALSYQRYETLKNKLSYLENSRCKTLQACKLVR